jgi:hypothetical protein
MWRTSKFCGSAATLAAVRTRPSVALDRLAFQGRLVLLRK